MNNWPLCSALIASGTLWCCVSCTSSKAGEFFPNRKVAALALALEHNDWAGADKALRDGVDVNAVGKDNMTLSAWTMYVKNNAAFEWLFNHGADPNFNPGGGDHCPLFWAAAAEDPDWLSTLLAHKANPNLTHLTSIGTTETPLLAAIGNRRLENLKMLIVAGADINYQLPNKDGGGTPAIDAACRGWFEGTYVLLEAGSDFRSRTTGGTDLAGMVANYTISADSADFQWREKVLQLLRQRGADVDGALKTASEEEEQYKKDNSWRYK